MTSRATVLIRQLFSVTFKANLKQCHNWNNFIKKGFFGSRQYNLCSLSNIYALSEFSLFLPADFQSDITELKVMPGYVYLCKVFLIWVCHCVWNIVLSSELVITGVEIGEQGKQGRWALTEKVLEQSSCRCSL